MNDAAISIPTIKVDDLHKSFGALEVIKGVSMTAHEGDIVSIIGASGSGKSTFLRCLNLLENPTSGSIEINGEAIDFKADKTGDMVPANRRQIERIRTQLGMVFQGFNLWQHMTVMQNIMEAPVHVLKIKKSEAQERAEVILNKVGLWEKRNQYPAVLSGGQQQRGAIARALAIIPALMAKKFDVIVSSMSITEERMKTIDFSDKYYNTPAVIITPKGSSIDGSPASVSGKIIGVQVSTIHENFVSKHYGDSAASIKTYQTFDEHNQDLVAGRIDAVVGDSLALQPFLASDSGACCEVAGELNDVAVFGPGVGGGMRKGDTELKARFNAAIAKIRADGTFQKISKNYFNFDIYGAE